MKSLQQRKISLNSRTKKRKKRRAIKKKANRVNGHIENQ